MESILDYIPAEHPINPESPSEFSHWPLTSSFNSCLNSVDISGPPQWKYASSPPDPEPYTYASLEPCLPDPYPWPRSPYSDVMLMSNARPQLPSFANLNSTVLEDSDLCPAAAMKHRCFMHDEGIGSSASSVSSMSPIVMQHDGSGLGQFVAERPSTSDSGCGLDPPLPEQPVPEECVQCATAVSTQWYTDGTGHFLCENCHVLYTARSGPPTLPPPPKRKRSASAIEDRECSNCQTRETSLWRRNASGNFNCNACGLYEKMNKCSRPLSMRKDTIKRRQRKTKADGKKRKPSNALETSIHEIRIPDIGDISQHSDIINLESRMLPRESVVHYAYDDHQQPMPLPSILSPHVEGYESAMEPLIQNGLNTQPLDPNTGNQTFSPFLYSILMSAMSSSKQAQDS